MLSEHELSELPEVDHPRWDFAYPPISGGLDHVFPVLVLGEESSGEPEIVSPNHDSFWEIVVQAKALYERTGIPPALMAKKGLMYPPHGPLLKRLGAFKVDRDSPSLPQLTAYTLNAKEEDRCTVIYPEGSRHKGKKIPTQIYVGETEDGRSTFKDGALRIGRDLGMNIRPAATVMRGDRHNITMYGEAFSPEGMTKDDLVDRMQAILNLAVAESCDRWGEDEVYNYEAVSGN